MVIKPRGDRHHAQDAARDRRHQERQCRLTSLNFFCFHSHIKKNSDSLTVGDTDLLIKNHIQVLIAREQRRLFPFLEK
jgi:hypothetical protein